MEITKLLSNGILPALLLFRVANQLLTLTSIQLIDKLVQIEDRVRTIYVSNDKLELADSKSKDQVTGLDLSLSSDLALYSCIKLLLIRRLVMLTRTTLKPMLLSGRTYIRLVFAFFMCPPKLVMLPALVLHLTRLIHTPNIFIVKSGRP